MKRKLLTKKQQRLNWVAIGRSQGYADGLAAGRQEAKEAFDKAARAVAFQLSEFIACEGDDKRAGEQHQATADVRERMTEIIKALLSADAKRSDRPVPMVMNCPACSARHIDAGEFETKPHHTHACQACGFVWRPAVHSTVGVQFLPGFRDEDMEES